MMEKRERGRMQRLPIFTARCRSACRGIEIACLVRPSVCMSVRLSVCPSVTLVDQDHISWNLEILETNCTDNESNTVALRSPQAIHLLPGEHGEIWGRLEVGWEKVACWRTNAEISLKSVKMEEKLLWRARMKSQTLFRTVPSATPYGLPFPKIGGSQPTPKLQLLLSQERLKLRTANLADTFIGSTRTQAREKFWRKKERGRVQGRPKYFEYPLLSQERVKLRTLNLAGMFTRSTRKKPFKIWEKRERGCIRIGSVIARSRYSYRGYPIAMAP